MASEMCLAQFESVLASRYSRLLKKSNLLLSYPGEIISSPNEFSVQHVYGFIQMKFMPKTKDYVTIWIRSKVLDDCVVF